MICQRFCFPKWIGNDVGLESSITRVWGFIQMRTRLCLGPYISLHNHIRNGTRSLFS